MGKRKTAATHPVAIHTDTIELTALLKWAQVAPTGGQAKRLIQEGQVSVNGHVETHRTRRVSVGDLITVGLHQFRITKG